MPAWLWFVDSLALVVVLLVLSVAWLVVRRRVITRKAGAAFDLSVNRHPAPAGGWMLGFAIYRDTELHWFRTFSMSFRPRYRFVRGEVEVFGRRDPVGSEVQTLHADHLVVETENSVGVAQLALSAGALTGLLSWLESSPPGQRVNRVL